MTRERDAQIFRLARRRGHELSLQAIGDMFGISRERVRQIIRREVLRVSEFVLEKQGISLEPWRKPYAYRKRSIERKAAIEERNAEIIACLKQGEKPRDIAESFGLTIVTVRKIIRDCGMGYYLPVSKNGFKTQFPRLYDRQWVLSTVGIDARQLAAYLGCSVPSIYAARRRFGLNVGRLNVMRTQTGIISIRLKPSEKEALLGEAEGLGISFSDLVKRKLGYSDAAT